MGSFLMRQVTVGGVILDETSPWVKSFLMRQVKVGRVIFDETGQSGWSHS